MPHCEILLEFRSAGGASLAGPSRCHVIGGRPQRCGCRQISRCKSVGKVASRPLLADANGRWPNHGTSRKQTQFDFGWHPKVSFDRITVRVLLASPLTQSFISPLNVRGPGSTRIENTAGSDQAFGFPAVHRGHSFAQEKPNRGMPGRWPGATVVTSAGA